MLDHYIGEGMATSTSNIFDNGSKKPTVDIKIVFTIQLLICDGHLKVGEDLYT